MKTLRNLMDLDAYFESVAKLESSFAGLYAENGSLIIKIATPGGKITNALRQRNISAIGKVFGATLNRFTGERRFEAAKFPIGRLLNWHRRVRDFQSLRGFVFSDVDEKRNRLVVGITKEAQPGIFEARLTEKQIPRDAVIIETVGPIKQLKKVRGRFRPLVGGVQIDTGLFRVCTAGFFVSFPTGERHGMVTNSHCSDVQGVVDGRVYKQPQDGVAGTNRIGVEIADPPYNISHSQCNPGRNCRRSDSLMAQIDSNVDVDRGLIARIGSWGSLKVSTSDPDYEISTIAWATLMGEKLTKIGRRTGKTAGLVTRTCAPTRVSDEQGNDTGITLVCQNTVTPEPNTGGGVTPLSDNGDSGSPVFRLTGSSPNPRHAVELHGILWGGDDTIGDFVFSPALSVFIELIPVVGGFQVIR